MYFDPYEDDSDPYYGGEGMDFEPRDDGDDDPRLSNPDWEWADDGIEEYDPWPYLLTQLSPLPRCPAVFQMGKFLTEVRLYGFSTILQRTALEQPLRTTLERLLFNAKFNAHVWGRPKAWWDSESQAVFGAVLAIFQEAYPASMEGPWESLPDNPEHIEAYVDWEVAQYEAALEAQAKARKSAQQIAAPSQERVASQAPRRYHPHLEVSLPDPVAPFRIERAISGIEPSQSPALAPHIVGIEPPKSPAFTHHIAGIEPYHSEGVRSGLGSPTKAPKFPEVLIGGKLPPHIGVSAPP